jgi:hypothetical protein
MVEDISRLAGQGSAKHFRDHHCEWRNGPPNVPISCDGAKDGMNTPDVILSPLKKILLSRE